MIYLESALMNVSALANSPNAWLAVGMLPEGDTSENLRLSRRYCTLQYHPVLLWNYSPRKLGNSQKL